MKSYNGFTAGRRQQAYNWLKLRISEGARASASAPCDACGQTEGRFDLHSENYAAPYGPHIGEFTLCYPCHMMVHCRHRDAARFNAYAYMAQQGHCLANPPQSWPVFRGKMLAGEAIWMWAESTRPDRLLLSEIARGDLDPRSRGGRQ